MCSESRNNMCFISLDTTSKDYKQGCWPLTGNSTRVLNVEHKLYTSCPQSKHYRVATQQFFLLQFSMQIYLQILKSAYNPHWQKLPQAATKPLLWMFLPLLKEYAPWKLHTFIFTLRARNLKTRDVLPQLGFISLVVLRDWKKWYHWKHSTNYSWYQELP